jgi:sarcosine oxidase
MIMDVDVVVIGGGAIGSSTAWWLARRGRSVVLAERFAAGHARGSSHGEVRVFRLAYPNPSDVRMALAALPLWRELEADCGEVLLEQIGALDHGPPEPLAAIAAALTAAGAAHEVLTPDAVTERWPGIRVEGPVVFHPAGGRTFADRTVTALQRRAAALGAAVRHECPARIVNVGADHAEVELAGDVVRARAVVVTAGSWVTDVLGDTTAPPLPPLTVTQETVIHFPAVDPQMRWPSFIHHDAGLRYGLPSLTEGIKVGGHHEGAVVDPDNRDFELNSLQVQQLTEYVERWLPGVQPAPQFGATCLYTTTPDESFVIDRRGPIVVGSACSGHGFKFTPLTGRRLADLADEAIQRE